MDAYYLSDEIRQLMLAIWNEESDEATWRPLTNALHYLECHSDKDKLPYMLRWLVKNKIVGKRFNEYLLHECNNSFLELQRHLLARIEGIAAKNKRILAGIDFK